MTRHPILPPFTACIVCHAADTNTAVPIDGDHEAQAAALVQLGVPATLARAMVPDDDARERCARICPTCAERAGVSVVNVEPTGAEPDRPDAAAS